MAQLTGTLLPYDRLSEVYPLIRTVAGVTERRWTAFARLHNQRGGHVMIVTDQGGRVYGAAAFRSGSTLRHQNSLIVDALAAFELVEGAEVKRVLCAALRDEARARGASTLIVETKPPTSLGERLDLHCWAELGLELEGITVVQDLGAASPEMIGKPNLPPRT
ncbi:hypothetical protein ACXYL9_10225 [Qipengyuania sp. CAU 1752]